MLHEGVQNAESPRLKLQLYVLLGRWWDERMSRPDIAVPALASIVPLQS